MTTTHACHACGERLGARRVHALIGKRNAEDIICMDCMEAEGAHARFYPGCSAPGHDMFSHEVLIGTRGATNRVIAGFKAQGITPR